LNFVSFAFVYLFAAALLARLLLGRRKTEQPYVWTLLVLSLVFYGWHIPAYLAILLASAGIDFWAGLALGRAHAAEPGAAAARRRKWVLAVSMTSNLGLLAFFKYANFGIDSAREVARAVGWSASWVGLDVVLPMGISFYTFQSMSYTIDVYRGGLAPLRSFRDFLLYIAFFPQLVAGPIVRATEFLPQLPRVRRLHLQVVNEALFLLASGYFLKMVCADNIAGVVDRHWQAGSGGAASAPTSLVLTLLFSGQIFCDFAGYSNIARGLALLLGYRLPLNFNAPYIAGSFKNFWELWHITLSSWLRDYLYVSLGGNRISRRRTYLNLMLVMLLGGLWHGAAWSFVAWGALHGTALAVERALGLHRDLARSLWLRAAWGVVVQVTVLVTWVLFRSESIADAGRFLWNIAAWASPAALPADVLAATMYVLPVVLLHAWRWLEERGAIAPLAPVPRAALAGGMVAAVLVAYGTTNAFIYFQF
jgi:alginate O-acetyltransferase complex protein AlgI